MRKELSILFFVLLVATAMSTDCFADIAEECEACTDGFYESVSDCGIRYRADRIQCKGPMGKPAKKKCKKVAQKNYRVCIRDTKSAKRGCLSLHACLEHDDNLDLFDSNR